MSFSETLIFVTGLLFLDKRVSYRRLRREFNLDDDTLEELRYEMIVVRRIALEENGEVLVWAANEAEVPIRPTEPGTQTPAPQPPARQDDSGNPSAVTEAERRQLTVMFCDLEGSTELAARMDPEDLRDIITRYQDTCRASIVRYDGFVARYMGDGLLVYFGYPQAHEDDPARAVRAGLDIVRSMSGLNAELGNISRINLAVRIGIATGPVVVGDLIGEGASEEAAVVGETPNLAARLQGIARSNQVVVDAIVRRLINNQFKIEDTGSHSLKGVSQPVQVWRVVSETDLDAEDIQQSIHRGSPLIGRQEELGLLSRCWEASKEGHGQVVSIQGEAGIGKSRLYLALRDQIAVENYLWVAIRCSPYHTHSSLYPVIKHMKRVMGWVPDDSNSDKVDKLESVLEQQGLILSEAVPLFAELLSLPLPETRYPPLAVSAQQQREQILDALTGWLFAEAEKQTVLQVWEDLHWADPTTLELLGLYIEQSPTVPMLNVLTYRPEFVPPWSMRSHITPITLNRMERAEVEILIGHQAGGKLTPDDVIQHVVDKSDGVPLYVEELTKTILESDYIIEEADRYVLTGSLSNIAVPSTLHDSLMARLDRVPMAREVAQLGAVLGREFAYEMLLSLSALEERALNEGLDQLVDNELLYQRGRPPRAQFIFKHALIHDAAYQSLLRKTRQQYHRGVARLLEQRFTETVASNPELAAHHFTEAGDLEQGVRYWLMAGERARELSANWEALGHLKKGQEVLEGMPDSKQRVSLELALQVSLGGANLVARGHAAKEVEAAYSRARTLCSQLGDVPEILSSVFGLWRFFIVCRHLEQALDIATQLKQLSREREDNVRYVIANYSFGFTQLALGRLKMARENMDKAIARYEPSQRSADAYRAAHDPGTACLAYASICEWLLGNPDRARRKIKQSLALAEQIQDAVSLAHALCFSTITSEARGEDEETGQMAKCMLTISLDKGFAAWIAVGRLTRTWIAVKRGEDQSAFDGLCNNITAFAELGFDILRPYFLSLMARAYQLRGQSDAGLQTLDRAQEVIDARAELWWQPEVWRLRGEMLLSIATNEAAEAEEEFNKALLLSREQRSRSLELRAAMSMSLVWQRSGKSEQARQLVQSVYNQFEEGFDTLDLRQATALLDRL